MSEGFYPTIVINDPEATVVESEEYGTISLQQYLTDIANEQALPNMLLNSSGYLGLANWTATGWTFTLIDGYRQSGGFVCNTNSSTSTLSQSVSVSATGVTLQLSIFTFISAGTLSVTVEAYQNTTLLSTILNESNFTANNSFTQYTFTTQAIPANTTNVTVSFSVAGASANTLVILSQILLTTSNILSIWNDYNDFQSLINGNTDLSLNNVTANNLAVNKDLSVSNATTLGLTGFSLPSANGTLTLAPGLTDADSGLQLNWDYSNGFGEVDFIDLCMGGAGGFNFYTYNNAGTLTTLGTWINDGAGLTVNTNLNTQNVTANNLIVNDNATLGLTGFKLPSASGTLALSPGMSDQISGLQLNWNYSNGLGEVDFIDLCMGGAGGFNFYAYNNAGTLATLGTWLYNGNGLTVYTPFNAPGISTGNIANVGTDYLNGGGNNISNNYTTAYKDVEGRIYNICNYSTSMPGDTSGYGKLTFAIAFNHIDTIWQSEYNTQTGTGIGFENLSTTQIDLICANNSSTNFDIFNLTTVMGR
jgi:hypothetical protein